MRPSDLQNFKSGVPDGHDIARKPGFDLTDAAASGEFDRLMDGFRATPVQGDETSIAGRWMRAPAAAYERAMNTVNRTPPDGMPPVQAMEFYTRKQIDLIQMKTLNTVVFGLSKLIKKNVEIILNNK